jgi:hypothetical protein
MGGIDERMMGKHVMDPYVIGANPTPTLSAARAQITIRTDDYSYATDWRAVNSEHLEVFAKLQS